MARHDPEADLWRSVLLFAVADALNGPNLSEVEGKKQRLAECVRARAYLTTPSRDLQEVCTLAGIDMAALIEAMTARIAEAPSPEDLLSLRSNRRAVSKPKAAKIKAKVTRYTFEDQHLTIREWSQRTGLKEETIRSRLNSGWTVEDALTLSVEEGKVRSLSGSASGGWKRGSPERTLTHGGQTLTIREWSQRTGLKTLTIKNRLRSGCSVSDALAPFDKRVKLFSEELS